MIRQQLILISGEFTKKKIQIHLLACTNSGLKKALAQYHPNQLQRGHSDTCSILNFAFDH